MTGSWLAMVIEAIVAGLLATTIGYCIVLNRRLVRLRADEKALKQTIAELITATETAERAIAGLKITVRDCDANLGDRIRLAERFTSEMDRQLRAGRDVLDRIVQITDAARPSAARAAPPPVMASEPPVAPELQQAGPTLNGFAGVGLAAFRAATEQGLRKTGATLQTAQALAERSRQRAAG